jgi:wyosine [tRNA(Phe)-imidazoG37] synthetase (radical SAM superfamily)
VPAPTLFQDHGRRFYGNRYVYPVLSRRAGGISIGLNLNRNRSCNFDCVYCQVDRSAGMRPETSPPPAAPIPARRKRNWPPPRREQAVDLERLVEELETMLDLVASGRIFEEPKFSQVPPPLRRLNDLAISGDGEPTIHPDFRRVVDTCAELRSRRQLPQLKLVLITNASMFHRRPVRRALEVLDANNGEIWAKLDAGTEAYFQQIGRTVVPFQQILDNLREAASARPLVIQSLLVRTFQEPPPPAEQEAYCSRLSQITTSGGRIKLVQVHTVARTPAESWVTPLSNAELQSAAELVRLRTGLPVATFPA